MCNSRAIVLASAIIAPKPPVRKGQTGAYVPGRLATYAGMAAMPLAGAEFRPCTAGFDQISVDPERSAIR